MSHTTPIIYELEARRQIPEFPPFRAGDTVRVHVRIVEGDKERIQAFEGVVIRRRRGGMRATFTVRKISYGVGVERTFPFASPRVERVEILAKGKVRRARLYYLRERTGKAARIRERVRTTSPAAAAAAASATRATPATPATPATTPTTPTSA